MLGAIIGDIIGSRFEWHNHRDKHFERFTEACRMTDDSIMTLVVAKALMETKKTCQMQHSIFQKNKEETIMKVRPSVKPICEKCKIIKRHGKVMVICQNPKHKQKQG